jgi:uncharacterized protein YjbJ (UPF0337 family)
MRLCIWRQGYAAGSITERTRRSAMDSNTDDLKGRAKEAVGDLTDNDELKREGRKDRAEGKAKDVIDDLGEKAKNVVDDVRDKLHSDDD